MRIHTICVTVVIAAGLAGLAPSSDAAGPYALTIMTATMPNAQTCGMATWAGTAAYAFGGSAAPTRIVRYDPVSNVATTMTATTASGWHCTTAVGVGDLAYTFGGSNLNPDDRIVRYNTVTDTATILPAVLPFPALYGTAVLANGMVYVAAGTQIAQFDPATETATLLATTLPTSTLDPTSVWDGTYMDIFNSCYFPCAAPGYFVERFDPAAGTVTTVALTGPAIGSLVDSASVFDGTDAYLFGGDPLSDMILKWTPGTTTLTQVGALPDKRDEMGIAWDGCAAWILAGGDQTASNQILRWGPQTCPPPPKTYKATFASSLDEKGCDSESFMFADASTPGGSFVSWSWNFGDGGTGSGQTVTHTYMVPGSYTVILTAVDDVGNPHQATDKVFVAFNSCPPAIRPFTPMTVLPGDTIHACAMGTAGRGGALSFSIDRLPGTATFADPCFDWVPGPQEVGNYGCMRVTVAETGSTETASTCLSIRVRAPDSLPEQDADLDGIADSSDNCPSWPNHEQADIDQDGVGDACDESCDASASVCGVDTGDAGTGPGKAALQDADLDGVPDGTDDCPAMPNRDQADRDRDHLGDACDTDADGDGVAQQADAGSFLDNCPAKANADQKDANGDGVGDACQASDAVAQGNDLPGPGKAPRAWSIWDGAGPWMLGALAAALLVGALLVAAGLRRR
ncbi:MAG: thrombospondin type 3 repeat-containing protein [bacterium]